jgi:hypothetical protein
MEEEEIRGRGGQKVEKIQQPKAEEEIAKKKGEKTIQKKTKTKFIYVKVSAA